MSEVFYSALFPDLFTLFAVPDFFVLPDRSLSSLDLSYQFVGSGGPRGSCGGGDFIFNLLLGTFFLDFNRWLGICSPMVLCFRWFLFFTSLTSQEFWSDSRAFLLKYLPEFCPPSEPDATGSWFRTKF